MRYPLWRKGASQVSKFVLPKFRDFLGTIQVELVSEHSVIGSAKRTINEKGPIDRMYPISNLDIDFQSLT